MSLLIGKLPRFPDSKPLEVGDKDIIRNFVSQFEPYSDFNFVSMYSWDVNGSAKISELYGNLVLRFNDYITQKPFYTFLGIDKASETTEKLIETAKKQNITTSLKLIPHTVFLKLEENKLFDAVEDVPNFDYVLSVQKLKNINDSEFHKKRNMVNRFIKDFGSENIKCKNLDIRGNKKNFLDVFYKWEKTRGKVRSETSNELMALKRVLSNDLDLNAIGIIINDEVVAFSIFEILPNKYSIIHYEKALGNLKGVFEFLNWKVSYYLASRGCELINYEQDLDIPGLKTSKMLYRPVNFLKKYVVSLRQ